VRAKRAYASSSALARMAEVHCGASARNALPGPLYGAVLSSASWTVAAPFASTGAQHRRSALVWPSGGYASSAYTCCSKCVSCRVVAGVVALDCRAVPWVLQPTARMARLTATSRALRRRTTPDVTALHRHLQALAQRTPAITAIAARPGHHFLYPAARRRRRAATRWLRLEVLQDLQLLWRFDSSSSAPPSSGLTTWSTVSVLPRHPGRASRSEWLHRAGVEGGT
jgi:hypothetical protein